MNPIHPQLSLSPRRHRWIWHGLMLALLPLSFLLLGVGQRSLAGGGGDRALHLAWWLCIGLIWWMVAIIYPGLAPRWLRAGIRVKGEELVLSNRIAMLPFGLFGILMLGISVYGFNELLTEGLHWGFVIALVLCLVMGLAGVHMMPGTRVALGRRRLRVTTGLIGREADWNEISSVIMFSGKFGEMIQVRERGTLPVSINCFMLVGVDSEALRAEIERRRGSGSVAAVFR